MTDKVDRLSWLLKTGCDCGFDTFRTHILLEFNTLLVLSVKLVKIVLRSLGRGLKVAQVLRVQIANLHRVPHLEVNLVWMKAKSLHYAIMSKNK